MTHQLPPLPAELKEQFTDALLRAAESIFSREDAAQTLLGFAEGEIFLAITRDQMYVRPIPPPREAAALQPPAEDHGRLPGMYL